MVAKTVFLTNVWYYSSTHFKDILFHFPLNSIQKETIKLASQI